VYRYSTVLLVPPAALITTFTLPLVPLGVVMVSSVAEVTFKLVPALPPKVTDLTPVKLPPWMVTFVPPLAVPVVGDSERPGRAP
jgi:hypothetical protein